MLSSVEMLSEFLPPKPNFLQEDDPFLKCPASSFVVFTVWLSEAASAFSAFCRSSKRLVEEDKSRGER
jgi:hypothetical protein